MSQNFHPWRYLTLRWSLWCLTWPSVEDCPVSETSWAPGHPLLWAETHKEGEEPAPVQLVVRALAHLLQRAKSWWMYTSDTPLLSGKGSGLSLMVFQYLCQALVCSTHNTQCVWGPCPFPDSSQAGPGVLCFFISCSLEHCVIPMILCAKKGSYLFHFTSCLFVFSSAQLKKKSNFDRNLKFSKERNSF